MADIVLNNVADLKNLEKAGGWPLAFGVYDLVDQAAGAKMMTVADKNGLQVTDMQGVKAASTWADAYAKLLDALSKGGAFIFRMSSAASVEQQKAAFDLSQCPPPPPPAASTLPTWVPWAVGAAVLFFLLKGSKK